MKRTLVLILMFAAVCVMQASAQSDSLMVLTNGVRVPAEWPPKVEMNYAPMPLPYMDCRPEVIPIDCGRQLFVDDYLIEENTLQRVAHTPKKVDFNPILKAETPLEMGAYGTPGASAKDGGVWWDSKDRVFKMWYEAGWLQTMAYAVSKDGIHWERPALNEKGNNAIVEDIVADSSTAWLDWSTDDESQRYKMFLRSPNTVPHSKIRYSTGWCMTSPDGIHWDNRVETGPCGDRSTVFYNPFIGKWVYSLRNSGNVDKVKIGRHRRYHECEDFMKGASWQKSDMLFWLGADSLDTPEPSIGDKAQLYNLSAIAYEGIMIALPQIHRGPSNKICQHTGIPKITDLTVAYSRDGFHWDRKDRGIFIGSERTEGKWDRGYVQSVGGICNIVGDQLWFHYIGFSGNSGLIDSAYEYNGMHYGGATGMAVLRRDGFVSMEAGETAGTLVTRPVVFSGSYMFVNVDCPKGSLKIEVLDKEGKVLKGFSAKDCKLIKEDSTIAKVKFKGNLSKLAGQPVRFRFTLENGALYAFWVTSDKNGASHGYAAAGGPGIARDKDEEGLKAYKVAKKYQLIKY